MQGASKSREQYREEILHITGAKPYSIHRTVFQKQSPPALYLHFHPEFEFLYLEEGEMAFSIEGQDCELNAGEAVFLPSYVLHQGVARSESGSFQAVVFSPELLAVSMETEQRRRYLPCCVQDAQWAFALKPEESWQREILELLRQLFAQADQQAKYRAESDLLTTGYLLVIWQHMYHWHFRKLFQRKEEAYQDGVWGEDGVFLAVQYIMEHYQDEVSLAKLADAAHMSKGQLCRKFKQFQGVTPFYYLIRHRIRKSLRYLVKTDKKIGEIGMLCGFNNISYFNREFLRMMRVTPSEYRRQALGGLGRRDSEI